MTLLPYGLRLALLGSMMLVSVGALLFYQQQQQSQRPGGRISLAKLAWLAYTVFVWFFLCPLLALATQVGQPLRLVLGSFAVNIWSRGVLELYMLYIRKNWRPPLGIAHDLLSLLLIAGLSLWYRTEMATLQHPFDRWVLGVLACVVISLGLEVWYASAFHHIVAGQTTGVQGVWFANEDEARFVGLNRATAVCNVPLYGYLLAFLSVCVDLW